jgi:hypothetical protein
LERALISLKGPYFASEGDFASDLEHCRTLALAA